MEGRPESAESQAAATVARPANIDDLTAHFRESYPVLKKVALGMVGPAEAEDVVQDAYALTAAKIKEGGQIENLGGWLYRVVRYQCIVRLRNGTPQRLDEDLVRGHTASTEELADLDERCGEIYGAVSKLKPAQRSAFLMAELQGFNYAEIGQRIGKTQHSVRLLLYRARNLVRDSVGFEGTPFALPFLRHVRSLAQHAADFARTAAAKFGNLSSAVGSVFGSGDGVAVTLTQAATVAVVGVVVLASPGVDSAAPPPASSPAPFEASTPVAAAPAPAARSGPAHAGSPTSIEPPATGRPDSQPSSIFPPATENAQRPSGATDSSDGRPRDNADPCVGSQSASGCPTSDTTPPTNGTVPTASGGGGSAGPLCPGSELCTPPTGDGGSTGGGGGGGSGGGTPPSEGGGGGGGSGGGTPPSEGGGGGGGSGGGTPPSGGGGSGGGGGSSSGSSGSSSGGGGG